MKRIWTKTKTQTIDTLLVIAEVLGGILMCLLFLLVSVAGFFWTLVKHLYKRDYSAKRQFKPIMRAFTLCNDCFANASGGEMLNDIMKAKDGEIKYGWFQQTISSVTGLRFLFNNRDSRLRRILNKVEKEHCELAPSEMELFYYKYKDKIKELLQRGRESCQLVHPEVVQQLSEMDIETLKTEIYDIHEKQ